MTEYSWEECYNEAMELKEIWKQRALKAEAVLRGIATFDAYTREDETELPQEAMRRMAKEGLDHDEKLICPGCKRELRCPDREGLCPHCDSPIRMTATEILRRRSEG